MTTTSNAAVRSAPRRIAERMSRLPTLPTSVARIQAALNDARTTANDVERAVRPDAALTTNLLRMANSPFFGMARKVESVKQAVMVLGLRRVYEATVGAAFSRVIPKRLPGYDLDAAAFWLHCVATAILSERLARAAHGRAPELIFTAGLLHDVGKLVIGSFLAEEPALVKEELRGTGATLIGAERALLETTHAEVGLEVCDRWQLPQAIGWAARWHHAPSAATAGIDRVLVDLVHVANDLAHMLGLGTDVAELQRALDEPAVTRLGLRPKQAEAVAAEAVDDVQSLAQLFLAPTEKGGH